MELANTQWLLSDLCAHPFSMYHITSLEAFGSICCTHTRERGKNVDKMAQLSRTSSAGLPKMRQLEAERGCD